MALLRIPHYMAVFLLLLGLALIAYNNSLNNAFMMDDGAIFSDVKLKNIKFLPNVFYPANDPNKNDLFIGSDLYYRPIAHIFFLISYLAFGNNPLGYHLVNLCLFALMGFMVFVFVYLFFGQELLALITSVLFILHPVNVFFVNYITSSFHALRFIMMFLSLIFFLKAEEGGRKPAFHLLSLICFGLALMCHEASMVLPFYIVFSAYFFRRLSLRQAVISVWPYGAVLIGFLIFRFFYTTLSTSLNSFHMNLFLYLISFSKIIYLYLSKLLLPNGIVFFWNSPLTTYAGAVFCLGGWMALITGCVLLHKKNPRGMPFFCALWLLLGFIPLVVASRADLAHQKYGLIIEPQWLTFSSAGFFLFVAYICLKYYHRWKAAISFVLIFLMMAWFGIIRYHNELWGDEYRYYFYWRQQIDPKPNLNYSYLGDIFLRKKLYSQARHYFSLGLQEKPDARLYYNVGLIDWGQGLANQAKDDFIQSVKLDPNYSSAFNNLGVIYFNQGDLQAAKSSFERTLQLDRYCIEARSNLAVIFSMEHNFQKAIELYKENLDIVPSDPASLEGYHLLQTRIGLK